MKRTLIIAVLTFSLFAPALPAHAIFGFGGCGAASAGGAGASGFSRATEVKVADDVSRAAETAQTSKECVLDGLAFALSEALISSITSNIVTWINSGFEGGPAYVTNLESFLGDIATNVSVDFIQGSRLGFLCSPFELPVRQILASNFQGQRNFSNQISCSLADVTNNVGGFLEGDFSQGGWQAWFRLHLEPQNNPFGALALSQAELNSNIARNQNIEQKKLDYGDGFFSKGECELRNNTGHSVDPETGRATFTTTPSLNTPTGCASAGGVWRIVTPGSQINSVFAQWLGVPADKLAAADEIDEVLNALLAQLSQQIFTSIDGLQGLSSNTSSSAFDGQSYLRNLTDSTDAESLSRARNVLVTDINAAINFEEAYQNILDVVIIGYNSAQNDYENLYQVCSAAGNTTFANTASSTLATTVTPTLSDYESQKITSIETISQLIAIRGQAQTALTVDTLNAAADAYQALIDSGVIHVDSDILLLVQESDAQQGRLTTFASEIALGLAACGSPGT